MSVAVALPISFRDDDHFSDENKNTYKKVVQKIYKNFVMMKRMKR